jgi:hypothetical protein
MTVRWIAQASAKGRRAVDYFFGYLHMIVQPSFCGQRTIFLNGALFSKTIFYFFGK